MRCGEGGTQRFVFSPVAVAHLVPQDFFTLFLLIKGSFLPRRMVPILVLFPLSVSSASRWNEQTHVHILKFIKEINTDGNSRHGFPRERLSSFDGSGLEDKQDAVNMKRLQGHNGKSSRGGRKARRLKCWHAASSWTERFHSVCRYRTVLRTSAILQRRDAEIKDWSRCDGFQVQKLNGVNETASITAKVLYNFYMLVSLSSPQKQKKKQTGKTRPMGLPVNSWVFAAFENPL